MEHWSFLRIINREEQKNNMEIKLKGLTKIFPGDPKKHIKDTAGIRA